MRPSKSRKQLFSAPLHTRSSAVRSLLSDELRTKYGRRSFRARKGDSVKVMRGEYKGIEAKVTRVYPDSGAISVEGVTREKIAGGRPVPVRIHASKVRITSLNLDDKWRKSKLEGAEEGVKEAPSS